MKSSGASFYTHFLKTIGFGSMRWGMRNLVLFGVALGVVYEKIKNKWMNTFGKRKK
tara:strand:+ start:266 stop:433 length:168 start_codon:yes stop_codon:yes gene_type:complete